VKKGIKKFNGFDIFVYIFMLIVVVATLYPFLNVLAVSFNDSLDTVKGGIYILPRKFTLANYKYIFTDQGINLPQAAFVSVARTVIGTITSVICSCMLAYTISRQDYVLRKFVTGVFVISMYVQGGLIPGYLLISKLGLIGNFWVYILPMLVSFYNVIIIRSFMDAIPPSLQESARIDGANDFQIFMKIIMPLSIPVIAVISLYVAVGQWSQWMDTFLYNGGKDSMNTLQYVLIQIMDNSNVSIASQKILNGKNIDAISPTSVQMAVTIIVTFPILCVYPFIQGYFVKGVTLGAVKG
jgi:putative aldouronate transport system permease protein